jgi:DNA-binding PadR family transcriptional regulator
VSYIEILILRRLRAGPAHGYELRKRVEQTTGVVLHNNSLYPALKRFEEAGAVTKVAEPQPGRPPRLVYTLTAVGHELLHDMIADLPPEQAAEPAEFAARLGQFSLINSAERARVLASRAGAVRSQLAHYEAMRDLAIAHGERWGAIATTELIRRHEQELAWLADLANLAAQPDPTDPGITNLGITNPGITDPGITNPGITDPGITNLGYSGSGISEPGPPEPDP